MKIKMIKNKNSFVKGHKYDLSDEVSDRLIEEGFAKKDEKEASGTKGGN